MSNLPAKPKDAPYQWLGLTTAHIGTISVGLYVGMLSINWPYIRQTFNLPAESLGIFLAVPNIGRLFFNLMGGSIMARISLRAFVVLGYMLVTLGITIHGLSPSWNILLFAALLLGCGDSMLATGTSTYMVSHYNARRLNWLYACFGIGNIFGPLLVTWFVMQLGWSWRIIYLLLGGLFFVMTLGMFFGTKSWTMTPSQHTRQPLRPATLRQTLTLPLVWILMTVSLVYGGWEVGSSQLANGLYIGRGIRPEISSGLISIFWLAFTIGRFVLGSLSERLGERLFLHIVLVTGLIATAFIWLYRPSPNITSLTWLNMLGQLSLGGAPDYSWIGMTLLGASLATMFPTILTYMSGHVGTQYTSHLVGLLLGTASFGSGFFPWLANQIVRNQGLEIIGPFLFSLGILLVITIEISLWQLQRVPAASKLDPYQADPHPVMGENTLV